MSEVWREDFIELVKRMGDEEQTHDNTGLNQEDIFKFFHEIEPEEEKNRIAEWEKSIGIV
ncbi:MAG: hypothetical protein K2K21_17975 [Lachnospiraceae bacterium]|nr:hypothetical protein [Lachnospiraceae bacterium]